MMDASGLMPLAGVRVLELGSDVSLAFATRLLADMGAEVLRPEPTEDCLRGAPPLLADGHSLNSLAAASKVILPFSISSLMYRAFDEPGGSRMCDAPALPTAKKSKRPAAGAGARAVAALRTDGA
jgi:hypothetical protein